MRKRLALAAFAALAGALPALGGQPAAAPDDNSLEAITTRLASSRIDEVNVDGRDPDVVLDLIRDAARVNIVVEADARRALEGKTVTLKLRGVTALSVLQHVLRQVGLVTTYADEALVVATEDSAKPHPQVAIYDIRSLTTAPKGSRLPPTLFGSQIDPLYYYWVRNYIGPVAGTGPNRDPFWELELLDTYPPDPIGEVIAASFQEKFKDTGVSVRYMDGYLVVVTQPKATRVPVLPPKLEPAKDTLPINLK